MSVVYYKDMIGKKIKRKPSVKFVVRTYLVL